MADINTFIYEQSKIPFKFGTSDCCTTCDKWVQLKTGVSPLSIYGQPITEETATEWLNAESLFKSVSRVMKKANFKITKDAKSGDIGLILLDYKFVAMAIRTDDSWFTRNEN